jgi:leucine dehydrogenase
MKGHRKSSASSSRARSRRKPARRTEAQSANGLLDELAVYGHEQVSFFRDEAAGYRGIIAIHSTVLGPALGGTRFWAYRSESEALTDVLRLSRAMTFKAATAGLDLGGGKSVIIGDNRTTERAPILRAHGRHIEALGGRYITAEDVGTSPEDMELVHVETRHVAGLKGGSGDPSPVTALGVYRGMKACAKYRWGTDSLAGRTVAVQGVGKVGYYLCRDLHAEGAKLVVTDVVPEKVKRVVADFGARAVAPEEIYQVAADIFAPCALGGAINDTSLRKLKVEVIAGGANNQLAEARHGDVLERRGVTYAPDYVINAGGLINVAAELSGAGREWALKKASQISDTVLHVLTMAREHGEPTYVAADRLAEQRLAEARSGRKGGGGR